MTLSVQLTCAVVQVSVGDFKCSADMHCLYRFLLVTLSVQVTCTVVQVCFLLVNLGVHGSTTQATTSM